MFARRKKNVTVESGRTFGVEPGLAPESLVTGNASASPSRSRRTMRVHLSKCLRAHKTAFIVVRTTGHAYRLLPRINATPKSSLAFPIVFYSLFCKFFFFFSVSLALSPCSALTVSPAVPLITRKLLFVSSNRTRENAAADAFHAIR